MPIDRIISQYHLRLYVAMDGVYPIIIYGFQLIIESPAPCGDIHKAIDSARHSIALCFDGCIVNLRIGTVPASGTIEIKARIIVLSSCLSGQDNTAIAVPPNKHLTYGSFSCAITPFCKFSVLISN